MSRVSPDYSPRGFSRKGDALCEVAFSGGASGSRLESIANCRRAPGTQIAVVSAPNNGVRSGHNVIERDHIYCLLYLQLFKKHLYAMFVKQGYRIVRCIEVLWKKYTGFAL